MICVFMTPMYVLILSVVAASSRMRFQHLRGLESAASDPSLNGPSFLSMHDFWSALDFDQLMQRDDVFVSAEGIDVSERLRLQFGASGKAECGQPFVHRNIPELRIAMNQILSQNTDVAIAAFLCRPRIFRRVLRPLTSLMISYIIGKRTMYLYDVLPRGLRDVHDYHKIFRDLPREQYRVIAGDVEGIIATLPDELGYGEQSEEDSRAYRLGRDYVLIRFSTASRQLDRIIDVRNACAVELMPGFRRPFINPVTREFNVQCDTSNHVVIWFHDTINPHWCQLIRQPSRALILPRDLDLARALGKSYGESSCDGADTQFLPDGSIQILDEHVITDLRRMKRAIAANRHAIESLRSRAYQTEDQTRLLRLVDVFENDISDTWRVMRAMGFEVSGDQEYLNVRVLEILSEAMEPGSPGALSSLAPAFRKTLPEP